ncbi:hypothetical protein DFH06DRAFT_128643 [Mycena polygramma]|nr:hypothetical protein DFH06DRAFT_128643 [Mycena polygramma]
MTTLEPTAPRVETSDFLKFPYFLRNNTHRPINLPHPQGEISISPNATVLDLWMAIETEHGDRYRGGSCVRCPGLIMVMSLWLVDCTNRIRGNDVLWLDMGLGTSGPLYPAQHNPTRGITLMHPVKPLSAYNLQGKNFRIVVDATFDVRVLPNVPPTQSAKRAWPWGNVVSLDRPALVVPRGKDATAPESSEIGKRQRLAGALNCPVYVTDVSDASPIVLPVPNSGIGSWLGRPGTVFLDKTGLIALFYNLLDHTPHIGVWLPSGTAKTATLLMLSSFFDVLCPSKIRKTFREMAIGTELRGTTPEAGHFGEGSYLCLMFDLQPANMVAEFKAKEYTRAFNGCISDSLRAFVEKYQKVLGITKPSEFFGSTDPLAMLQEVFDTAKTQRKRVFIGVDNVDAFLLTSLTYIRNDSNEPFFWTEVKLLIDNFLDAVVAGPATSKILVFGQLPVVGAKLKAIPDQHPLHSAFTMADEEMETYFSVITGGTREMDRISMGGLEGKHAPAIQGARPITNTFTLFLYHMAQDFDGENEHTKPTPSPLLASMLKRQQDLFVNLCRCREAAVPAFTTGYRPNFLKFSKDQIVAFWVLYRTGALEFSRVRPDGQWVMQLTTNSIIHDQIFDGGDSEYTPLTAFESEVQELSAGRVDLLTGKMSSLLFHTPIHQLADTTEGAFQAMFDTRIKSERSENYFAQVHLILDHVKSKESKTDNPGAQSTSRTQGRNTARTVEPKAAQSGSGYSDCLTVGMDDLALRTAVIIELKYVHLNGLVRAEEGEWLKWGPFRTQRLKDMNRKIRGLKLSQLKDMKYCYRDRKTGKDVETTVGAYIGNGDAQVQAYADALASGQGNTDDVDPLKHKNGILDRRVKVGTGSDLIVPIVFAGIGSRVIGTHLKDVETSFKYTGRPNWKPDH